jgi:methionyl-tRNA formyltransferase
MIKYCAKKFLECAPKGFWNIHHSYNLRLRGRNITTHAIIRSKIDNIYYHGTTIHKMVPQLDAGPIVASEAIEICTNDTAYTLFNKVNKIALKNIL